MPADDAPRAMIVFSDLDGTLLDHETYRWDAAEPALDRLRGRGIPLVLASSKTAAEIAPIRDDIGFAHCPAIVENGAGVLCAEGHEDDEDEATYARLRTILDDAPHALRAPFVGFGDMGIGEIARVTGLPRDGAALAADRRFSEPGLWSADDGAKADFVGWLADHGIAARDGGRFLTLSFGGTKAERMDAIIGELFKNSDAFVVALGDAPNDIEMLERADRAFIVANPSGKPVPKLAGEDDGSVTRTTKSGPAGWNAAMLSILST